MDVLTLAATCGLAARAALFVPLSGAPSCTSATPVLRGDGHEAVAVWQPDIAAAAQRFDIPEAWIAAVMRAESGGQATVDGEPIRSPAGAMGLMQVMPQTYAALRARYGLGADPRSPRDNILAGAAYLREMLDRYGVPWFLAAYNAGPAPLDAFLRTGRALPAETQRYLAALAPQIGGTWGALQAAVGTTGLSTKPAPEATVPGPKDAISAGLFATVVAHSEASPARTVTPIVRPRTRRRCLRRRRSRAVRLRPDLSRDPSSVRPMMCAQTVRCSSPSNDAGAPRMIGIRLLSMPRLGVRSDRRTARSLHQFCARLRHQLAQRHLLI